MIRTKPLLSLLALTTFLATSASAVVIDFNLIPLGDVISGPNAISPHLSISSVGGSPVRIEVGPNTTYGVGEIAPRSGYRVDFHVQGVNAVSVDLGDYNHDSENIYLRAYSAAGTLLASTQALAPTALYGYMTLSLNAANIGYILFGSEASSMSGEVNTVYFDNLSYLVAPAASVPDSGRTLLLLAGAVGALAFARRRFAA